MNLISRAREIVDDPRAIVMPVISESFVQRGLPAVIPSDVRTRQALRCGADVVLGLPFTYSCAPSARFALGGIATLLATGVVTDIAFGYDAGTPELLKELSDRIDEDSPEFREALKNALSGGSSYPAARAAAVKTLIGDDSPGIDEVLRSPNSILALEYLSALKKIDRKHKVNIIMIPRDQSLESATSIREKITSCAPSYSQAELYTALKDRFPGDWMIAVRYHPNVKDRVISSLPYVVDATDYPDMQELLYTANALVSDYSSCIWDYSFTYRPCFLFCYDLKEYYAEKSFDLPIEEWGFPICVTMEDLTNAIRSYDADSNRKAMDQHHEAMGSLEDGHATERVCTLIRSLTNRDKEGGL